MRHGVCFVGMSVLIAVSCSADGSLQPPITALPRWEETWSLATHNSYWADRGVANDTFASGVGERILDQLLGDGARSVEIDVHRDRDHAGKFLVYHTEPGNGVCASLADCLAILRAYQDALPQHAPTLVVIELKEIIEPNFTDTHSMDDLDAELRAGLGAALYTPGDQLARCAALGMEPDEETGELDLGRCVDELRWPAIDALAGRFIVGVLGNWDLAGTTADWAKYATTNLPARAAFPMSSTWKLDYDALSANVTDRISRAELERAAASSVLVQVEEPTDPLLAPSLARGAVVRIDNAFTEADQGARLALGAQLLQTDTPWIRTGGLRVDAPLTSFREGVSPDALREPGARLALRSPGTDRVAFAFQERATTSTTVLSSTIVSGHDATAVGCLRAESSDGAAVVSACRARVDAPGQPDNQRLGWTITHCSAGACSTETLTPNDQRFAERVALRIVNQNGAGCATIQTATGFDPIAFALLGSEICVDAPLVRQGIMRTGASDGRALFYRTTASDAAMEALVGGSSLWTVTEDATGQSSMAPEILEDLSVDPAPK